ncbi:hypothetical protein [Dyadobacter sp. 3J3]|uniref:hypothetical protein n=1 Tax=Dyadobacter sp. 3J3 TaxID=2606600 RepID=UPI001E54CD7A|nr:hypothetical protein [Dyadobacter sp. 3J3]
MMDPSKKNSFDEQWKKAFQEASETPPLSAWEGIEARLDEEERDKVVPLWWKTPGYWYAAASVAALLLVGISLWDGSNNVNNSNAEKQVAANKTSPDTQKEVLEEDKSVIPTETQIEKERVLSPGSTIAEVGRSKGLSENAAVFRNTGEKLVQQKSGFGESRNTDVVPPVENNVAAVSGFNSEEKSLLASDFKKIKETPEAKEAQELTNNSEKAVEIAKLDAASQILAEALMPIGYKDLDVYMQKRYVFYKPDAMAETKLPKKEKKKQEYWADVNVMPASFNPNINVTNAPSAYASANASRQSLSGSSKSGSSYAVQTQGAKRISKHWSVETGLNYLQGNSTYEGGGYLLNAVNSQSENVLQSALADKTALGSNAAPNSPALGSNYSSNTLYIALNKEVINNYRFVQVPVQAGFTLNPDKKLSYSVVGGVITNFFVNNEFEAASGSVITTKAKDDVYRNLNYSATTGLRFNYKLSAKLKATLSGSYQKSLLSGFKNSESLESHPSLYGVAWGVRYSF